MMPNIVHDDMMENMRLQRDYLLGVLTRMSVEATHKDASLQDRQVEAMRVRATLLEQANRSPEQPGHLGAPVGVLRLYGRQ